MRHTGVSTPVALPDERTAATDTLFDSVVAAYQQKVFRFTLASVRDRDAAETITQDCFLRAHRAWENFRNECSYDAWLLRIASNLIRDYGRNQRLRFWRRVQKDPGLVGTLAGLKDTKQQSPEARLLVTERVDAVWEAAASLPHRQRTVFLLRFVEEKDILEIASITGMKEGTVKTHLLRALSTVRRRIGG